MVGNKRTRHLRLEQRFKVVSEFVQTTSPGTCWHMADLGFGVLAKTRASGIQRKKPFLVSEGEKMKKAAFLGGAAKGEADEEQKEEETWEKQPVKSREVTRAQEA